MTYHSRWQRSSARDAAAEQTLLEEPFPAFDPPPPAEWMPLDEIAHAWGTFGARTPTAQGWLATSSAFAALAMEAEAYQHTAALLARANRTLGSRDAASAAISALGDVLARWQMALLWLNHVRRHPAFFDQGNEEAAAYMSDLDAHSRWHLLRVSRLQSRLREEWIQQALWPAVDLSPRLHLGHCSLTDSNDDALPALERATPTSPKQEAEL